MQGKAFKELFNGKPEEKPAAAPPVGEEMPDVEVGPCASVARGKWVTALTIKAADGSRESFQYRDMATRSEFTPTRFVVVFEGRQERYTVVVKGRNLVNLYETCIQHRLEWIEAVLKDRDFAKDGEKVVTSVEVVMEPVKG